MLSVNIKIAFLQIDNSAETKTSLPRNKLIKEVWNQEGENYETLLREIKNPK